MLGTETNSWLRSLVNAACSNEAISLLTFLTALNHFLTTSSHLLLGQVSEKFFYNVLSTEFLPSQSGGENSKHSQPPPSGLCLPSIWGEGYERWQGYLSKPEPLEL